MSFFLLLVLSILLGLSSCSFFSVWVALELNLMSFLILLTNPMMVKSSLSSVQYFLVQSLGSGFFFICLLSSSFQSYLFLSSFMVLTITWKLGMAPFQGWLLSLSSNLSWESFFYINSIQKIIPLFILLKILGTEIMSLVLVGVFLSIIGGVCQLEFKKILIYSSVLSLVWICSSSRFYEGLLYLSAYSISLFLFTFYMEIYQSAQFSDTSKLTCHQGDGVMLLTLFLSFSGMPPFIGFYPKLLILSILVGQIEMLMIFSLLLGSSVFVYLYIRLFLTNLTLSNLEVSNFQMEKSSYFIFSAPLWVGLVFFCLLCVFFLNFDFKLDKVTYHT